jgi:hypothetical protein
MDGTKTWAGHLSRMFGRWLGIALAAGACLAQSDGIVQPASSQPLLPVAVGLERRSSACGTNVTFFAYEAVANARIFLRLSLGEVRSARGSITLRHPGTNRELNLNIRQADGPDRVPTDLVVLRSGAESAVLEGIGYSGTCIGVSISIPALAK